MRYIDNVDTTLVCQYQSRVLQQWSLGHGTVDRGSMTPLSHDSNLKVDMIAHSMMVWTSPWDTTNDLNIG